MNSKLLSYEYLEKIIGIVHVLFCRAAHTKTQKPHNFMGPSSYDDTTKGREIPLVVFKFAVYVVTNDTNGKCLSCSTVTYQYIDLK